MSLFKRRSTPAEKKILLYGLQRSGTNYLASLLTLNAPRIAIINGEDRSNITHKHFRLYNDKSKIPEPQFRNNSIFTSFDSFEIALPVKADLFVIISKDPYSWLKSYLNWAKKNKWPAHDYHYIDEYNLFYSAWKEFSQQADNIIFIRYIDLLNAPLTEINRILTALHLTPLAEIKNTKKVYASRKFTTSKKNEILNKSYMSDFSEQEIKEIDNLIDRRLLEFLNYKI